MSRTVVNTAFKTKIDDTTDAIRLSEHLEHGALLRTETGIWAHHDKKTTRTLNYTHNKGARGAGMSKLKP